MDYAGDWAADCSFEVVGESNMLSVIVLVNIVYYNVKKPYN